MLLRSGSRPISKRCKVFCLLCSGRQARNSSSRMMRSNWTVRIGSGLKGGSKKGQFHWCMSVTYRRWAWRKEKKMLLWSLEVRLRLSWSRHSSNVPASTTVYTWAHTTHIQWVRSLRPNDRLTSSATSISSLQLRYRYCKRIHAVKVESKACCDSQLVARLSLKYPALKTLLSSTTCCMTQAKTTIAFKAAIKIWIREHSVLTSRPLLSA